MSYQLITMQSNYFINIKWYIYTNTKLRFGICMDISFDTNKIVRMHSNHFIIFFSYMHLIDFVSFRLDI